MAYTMVHILAADRVLEYFPIIEDYSTYILGTIAPDAVHSNPDYTTKWKERSHLFAENHQWGMIDSLEAIEEWLGNIKKYYMENRGRYNRDFLLGYIVHLMVDVYNSMHFYAPLKKTAQNDSGEIMERYKREVCGINFYLLSQYEKQRDLRRVLDDGKAVTLQGVIDREDILKRIDDLFRYEFESRDISGIKEYTICTIEGTKRLIENASLFVRNILADEYIPEINGMAE